VNRRYGANCPLNWGTVALSANLPETVGVRASAVSE
jgi:hypothetical protein